MPDDMDRAQERDEQMRQDALAEQLRRTQMEAGDSAKFCVLCETEIPQDRRLAVPGVQTCIECQADLEKAVL